MPRTFLSATWRHLAIASWRVDPALLAPLVPAGTELDRFDTYCWASVVGFRFEDTRVLGVPVPGHREFDEVNLRFYLRREGPEGSERGVTFVREMVPKPAIATIARIGFGEPYRAMPMSSSIDCRDGTIEAEYRWKLARWNRFRVIAADPLRLPDPGERDGWIAEHYWGWTRRRNGRTSAYRVEHPPWRLRRGVACLLDADVAETWGQDWARAFAAPPESMFLAEGSDVTVGWPSTIAVG